MGLTDEMTDGLGWIIWHFVGLTLINVKWLLLYNKFGLLRYLHQWTSCFLSVVESKHKYLKEALKID